MLKRLWPDLWGGVLFEGLVVIEAVKAFTKYLIETGGSGKGKEQFKGFDGKKNLILSHGNETTGIKRPFFLLGF
ncbi:MAG TPA: hypothetical protein HPP97_10890 [Desulfuromonadales bacterium]|nr:hypothetical protein [Desulfuromonadales bacterium]